MRGCHVLCLRLSSLLLHLIPYSFRLRPPLQSHLHPPPFSLPFSLPLPRLISSHFVPSLSDPSPIPSSSSSFLSPYPYPFPSPSPHLLPLRPFLLPSTHHGPTSSAHRRPHPFPRNASTTITTTTVAAVAARSAPVEKVVASSDKSGAEAWIDRRIMQESRPANLPQEASVRPRHSAV